jgi:Spy/CpxP family protein refolding chaperone
MKVHFLVLAVAGCALTLPVRADNPSPYAGQQIRTIKALSAEEIAGLLKGDGLGFAKAAELNGYPGPRHLLDLGDRLKLTAEQRQQVQAIFDRMSAAAKPLGAEAVDRERRLDQLFQTGAITPEQLATETAAIGDLQGRLRAVHLAAHLETRALLNPDQLALYRQLRGYGSPDTTHHHHD